MSKRKILYIEKQIKDIFLKKLFRYYQNKYLKKDHRKKVLIQTNRYYTQNLWSKSIHNLLPDYMQKIQLIFADNELKFIALCHHADICFCYGLNKYIDFSKARVKMIYFGLSGLEFLENIIIPDHICIFSCQGIASKSIAEYTLMATLILIHRFQHALRNQNQKKWSQKGLIKDYFKSIRDHKIGILGIGNNGLAVAELFKQMGCYICGYDIAPNLGNENIDKWYFETELDELLKVSDIVIICLPLNNQTNNLITLDKLKLIGPDSYLINTARGEIINEKDLIEALNNKYIKGAVLDTITNEPLPKKSDLWKTSNLVISPHIFGNVNNFVETIQEDFINKVKSFLDKEI